ncbi:cysteine desulfurase family protein [Lederbergia citrea]|uniref:cysteine desulfurase n=1 Tax=Lederbergia citrea TaxID=2833581 RepID=A0A942UTA3_9BACI|nr:cysteine desulfurase family protein [Lederbergia citrea]MBS4176238.1 cysteine desulfurase [Lederbergia citrea]MBS4202798.1 cysteine desulfurase [Lederbergia citrea]MBS4222534.1 cysteine desulfurase [Lederbergia citrea]
MNKIYLDHAATSPVHPKVAAKMTEVLTSTYGNPSSIHSFGRDARRILDEARTVVARSINAQYNEIVFTSGGTEADNLAIIGVARANLANGKHIITSKIEHHAVLHACEFLENEGFEITWLEPDDTGIISVDTVKKSLRDDTILVTIMYGNNEVGTVQPIKEIGELLANHQAYFHTDAVQAYGLETIDVTELYVDLLSVSAHKINGPKGVGFLFIKTGTKINPGTFGGEQELKKRAGTENLASIAGFAEAVTIAKETMDEKSQFFGKLKKDFIQVLESEKIDFAINGSMEHALPHVLNISFPGTDVEAMLVNLDMAGIAASSGSACTAGSIEPSHVLVAMFGGDSERIRNSIRFSFGLDNTLEEITDAAKETAEIARRLQK